MPAAMHTVTIRRPREEVFAFVANHENDPRWRNGILEISRASGDGVGEVWRQAVKGPLGRRIPADIETTQVEPGHVLMFRAIAGPVRPIGRFDFADGGDGGTRVTFSLNADLAGAKTLMAPMVTKTMQSEVAALDRLTSVLESEF